MSFFDDEKLREMASRMGLLDTPMNREAAALLKRGGRGAFGFDDISVMKALSSIASRAATGDGGGCALLGQTCPGYDITAVRQAEDALGLAGARAAEEARAAAGAAARRRELAAAQDGARRLVVALDAFGPVPLEPSRRALLAAKGAAVHRVSGHAAHGHAEPPGSLWELLEALDFALAASPTAQRRFGRAVFRCWRHASAAAETAPTPRGGGSNGNGGGEDGGVIGGDERDAARADASEMPEEQRNEEPGRRAVARQRLRAALRRKHGAPPEGVPTPPHLVGPRPHPSSAGYPWDGWGEAAWPDVQDGARARPQLLRHKKGGRGEHTTSVPPAPSLSSPSSSSLSSSWHGLRPEDVPPELVCAVTREVFVEPVLCLGDGHTYEAAALETWVGAMGKRGSPITNQPLASTEVAPNHLVATMVHRIAAEQGKLLGDEGRGIEQESESDEAGGLSGKLPQLRCLQETESEVAPGGAINAERGCPTGLP